MDNYGLSGPSGARPCLHCHNVKKPFDMEPSKRPLDEQATRTLQMLQTDHQRFVDAGSRLSQAKLFNNAARPLILPIEIVNVVIRCIWIWGFHLALRPYGNGAPIPLCSIKEQRCTRWSTDNQDLFKSENYVIHSSYVHVLVATAVLQSLS